MTNNAATFLEEMRDPNWSTLDPAALAACPARMLLTYGDQDQSSPFLGKVVDVLRTSVPQMRVTRIEGAGHLPARHDCARLAYGRSHVHRRELTCANTELPG